MAGDVKRILVLVILVILLCLAVLAAIIKIAWIDRSKPLKERARKLGTMMGFASLLFAVLTPWMIFAG